MEFISNYMKNDTYRHMLNELTQKIFWFDFEEWVINGFFEGDYIPYSYVKDGRIISNVSANRMIFMENGATKNYIQIGTVMTDEAYRGQGLARELMQRVIKEYECKCDGIYLFGNLGAVGFYEKMGFNIMNQYRYYVKDEFCNTDKMKAFEPIKSLDEEIQKKYRMLVRTSAHNSSFEQINKYGLTMFYTADLDNVYYASDIDCFVVMDKGVCTVIESVLSNQRVPLIEIIKRIDEENNKFILGFTPCEEDRQICSCELYDGEDDYRLFYRGDSLKAVEDNKLYFPNLSHA